MKTRDLEKGENVTKMVKVAKKLLKCNYLALMIIYFHPDSYILKLGTFLKYASRNLVGEGGLSFVEFNKK